jgi:D-alanine-D-alanine ligase
VAAATESGDQSIAIDIGITPLAWPGMVVDPASAASPAARPGPKVRLLVLYGGRSAEHEISCISAFHVVNALDPARYDLRLTGITTDGRWVDATDALPGGGSALPSPDLLSAITAERVRSLEPMAVVTGGGPTGSPRLAPESAPLVVLPLLHGPLGEDGTLQGLLEVAGVPYCGPGVAGSAAAMDKGLAKSLVASSGLPQARHLFVRESQIGPALADRVDSSMGWPVFVKPANMGSSIGISRVKDAGGLSEAVTLATRYDEYVIIEEAIEGRELEIGVLGWPELRVSVPGEIRPSRDFYDFEDKYLEGAAGLEVPARLPDEVAQEMGRLAIAACEAMRVDCMARVDFFFEQGGRGLLINEVNTIPGFTPISMYPRMWAATGVSYPALIDALVQQALRRADRRNRFEVRRASAS